MQVQQTPDVSFGMIPKVYGIRYALKAGSSINDFKEVRGYIGNLEPELFPARIRLKPAIVKGKNLLKVEMECGSVKITSDDYFVKQRLKKVVSVKLKDIIKATADEVWLRLLTSKN